MKGYDWGKPTDILSYSWSYIFTFDSLDFLILYNLINNEQFWNQIIYFPFYSAASLAHQAPWHQDQLPQSVTLSWHWAKQSSPYPNNAERQVRRRHVSILKSLVWRHVATVGAVVLRSRNNYGYLRMDSNFWQCRLVVTIVMPPLWAQTADSTPRYPTVTISWSCANQCLSYSIRMPS